MRSWTMTQLFKSPGGGVGPRRPTRVNFSASALPRPSCHPSLANPRNNRRRARRFVVWLTVSFADRDLFFQDPRVLSSRAFAPPGFSAHREDPGFEQTPRYPLKEPA